MNRREMLQCVASSVAALSFPGFSTAQITPYKWFTRKQLLHLFKQLDGQTTRETVDMVKLRSWSGIPLEPHESVHLAIMRMSNIMYRKTLDGQSQHWLVIAPEMCLKTPDIWHKFQFSIYSTPGKQGGTWQRKHWKHFVKEQVCPGVYNVGNLCGKWQFYVCEGFPDNKIMLGMGYKQVIHFRKEGMKQYEWGEYPNLVPYMDKPTRKNYAIITLEDRNRMK